MNCPDANGGDVGWVIVERVVIACVALGIQGIDRLIQQQKLIDGADALIFLGRLGVCTMRCKKSPIAGASRSTISPITVTSINTFPPILPVFRLLSSARAYHVRSCNNS